MTQTVYPDSIEGRQLFYDVTVAHLRAMPAQAGAYSTEIEDFVCSYLDPSGAKCAIGYHIPDGHPAQHYVGSFSNLITARPDLDGVACPQGQLGRWLAEKLQDAHDTPAHWGPNGFNGYGEHFLKDICVRHGLGYKPPTPAPAPALVAVA